MGDSRALKAQLEQDGRLLRVHAVDESLRLTLANKACKVEWIVVRNTHKNVGFKELKLLFAYLKKNISVTCLDLRSAFATPEFNQHDELKEEICQALAELLKSNFYIDELLLGSNVLPLAAVNHLVKALDHFKGKKESIMRTLDLSKGNFGGVDGINAVIKTQLDNKSLAVLRLVNSLSIAELKKEDGNPSDKAVVLMRLYNHPGMAEKIKFDDEVLKFIDQLQRGVEVNYRASPRRAYKEASPRKSLDSPNGPLPPLVLSASPRSPMAKFFNSPREKEEKSKPVVSPGRGLKNSGSR